MSAMCRSASFRSVLRSSPCMTVVPSPDINHPTKAKLEVARGMFLTTQIIKAPSGCTCTA